MIRAYCQSAATLNLLRAFATGGYAAMQRVSQWNLDFSQNSEQGDRYRELAQRVDEALGFMFAAGITVDHQLYVEQIYFNFLSTFLCRMCWTYKGGRDKEKEVRKK